MLAQLTELFLTMSHPLHEALLVYVPYTAYTLAGVEQWLA